MKFQLGQVVQTQGVANSIPLPECMDALNRHINGDWGDLCKEDRKTNDKAIAHEGDKDRQDRVFSCYKSKNGTKFYIITEWDRSVTTLLLPEEY